MRVSVKRNEKFKRKKNTTDAKMGFYTGITSAALFNTVFTLKPYVPHIKNWKGPKEKM